MAITSESCPYLSLAQASRLIPPTKGDRPVHTSTITRWIVAGVRSGNGNIVRLKARKFPGGWKVSPDALEEFLDELTRAALSVEGAPTLPDPSKHRQKEIQRAENEAALIGI
jgi:hypothetical protein